MQLHKVQSNGNITMQLHKVQSNGNINEFAYEITDHLYSCI